MLGIKKAQRYPVSLGFFNSQHIAIDEKVSAIVILKR
jgi:hypothetical protein